MESQEYQNIQLQIRQLQSQIGSLQRAVQRLKQVAIKYLPVVKNRPSMGSILMSKHLPEIESFIAHNCLLGQYFISSHELYEKYCHWTTNVPMSVTLFGRCLNVLGIQKMRTANLRGRFGVTLK